MTYLDTKRELATRTPLHRLRGKMGTITVTTEGAWPRWAARPPRKGHTLMARPKGPLRYSLVRVRAQVERAIRVGRDFDASDDAELEAYELLAMCNDVARLRAELKALRQIKDAVAWRNECRKQLASGSLTPTMEADYLQLLAEVEATLATIR